MGDMLRLETANTETDPDHDILSNAAQKQAILDLIAVVMREWSESFLGYLDEHMAHILDRQADAQTVAHNEREALKARFIEAHDQMMNYVTQFTLRADVGVREVRLEHAEILDALAERLTTNEQANAANKQELAAMQARLDKAGL